MQQIAVLIPVGPAPREITRLRALLGALFAWEPGPQTVLLLDDSLTDRRLPELFEVPDGVRLESVLNPRLGRGNGVRGGLCEGVLAAYRRLAEHSDADFVLRIDTDALVVGPFVERVRALFARHPDVGMLGTFDRHCDGRARSYLPWDRVMRRLSRPVSLWLRLPRPGFRVVAQGLFGGRARLRRVVRAARQNGYVWGEHCLGGANAVRLDVLLRARAAGYLDHPEDWRDIHCSEDALMGMLTRAVGYRSLGANAAGEPFGCEFIGLPALPEEIVRRGYALIHSVKNDERLLEGEIRSVFDQRRPPVPELRPPEAGRNGSRSPAFGAR